MKYKHHIIIVVQESHESASEFGERLSKLMDNLTEEHSLTDSPALQFTTAQDGRQTVNILFVTEDNLVPLDRALLNGTIVRKAFEKYSEGNHHPKTLHYAESFADYLISLKVGDLMP